MHLTVCMALAVNRIKDSLPLKRVAGTREDAHRVEVKFAEWGLNSEEAFSTREPDDSV
jgi:hypothetical protein